MFFCGYYSVGKAQNTTFDTQTANMGTNKFILWQTSATQGHSITNIDVPSSNRTDLRIRTHNSGSVADMVTFTTHGQVGIGTNLLNVMPASGFRLYVREGIRTERVLVDVAGVNNWADFVFSPTYRLRPLQEVEAFIKKKQHLPDVPSASEIAHKGLDLAEMQKIQMQKIEELTLYLIELKKENEELKHRIQTLEKK